LRHGARPDQQNREQHPGGNPMISHGHPLLSS
jgi:hypothetical protein